MDNSVEVRYAGVVVGRGALVKELGPDAAFVGISEPLPVGTLVTLKIGDAVREARVDDVVESSEPTAVGMRVRWGGAAPAPHGPRDANAAALAAPERRRARGRERRAGEPPPAAGAGPRAWRAPALAQPASVGVESAPSAERTPLRATVASPRRSASRATDRGATGRKRGRRQTAGIARVIRPPTRLDPGDVVRVVAPAGPRAARRASLAGAEILEGGATSLRYDDGLFARDGYLAGSDERRLAELTAAFADPEARAVVLARGGYGLLRILPFLDPAALRARPLPIVGFSRTGRRCSPTPLPRASASRPCTAPSSRSCANLARARITRRSTRLLEEPAPGCRCSARLAELVPGPRAQARCSGGNLRGVPRASWGRPTCIPDLAGAILFLEDLGERPYRLDRLVTHLDLSGVFGAVAGVIVGDFSSCLEPEPTRASSPTAAEVLVDRLSRLAIPVVTGGLFGHGTRNLALPYGCLCELDTPKGALFALQGAVS